jgi:DNA-binding HxlR family transcriptional regulator
MADGKTQTDNGYLPTVPFKTCPIQRSLGVMGRKWTMLILRDIGFLKIDRFNQILKATPGLTPRVLSLRLHELESEGFIQPIEVRANPHMVRWALTEKGKDTFPVLMSFIEFGSKWYSAEVFADSRPRGLQELFPSLPRK